MPPSTLNSIIGYAAFAFAALVALLAGVVCIVTAVRFLKRQIKLNHSIRLVELKTVRVHYVIFLALDFGCIVFTAFAWAFGSETAARAAGIFLGDMQAYAVLGALLFLLAAFGFLLIVLLISKSAVVDKGVYTALNYLDWYHVHDYIIDESTGTVILSTSGQTFSTIKGTTAPLKVKKDDIPKLKFILNKNKNKFSRVQ